MALKNVNCPFCKKINLSFTKDTRGREIAAFCNACGSIFVITYRAYKSGWKVIAQRKNPEYDNKLDSEDFLENLQTSTELDQEGISQFDGEYTIDTIQ